MTLIASTTTNGSAPPTSLGAALESQQMESFEYNRKLIELFNQFQEAEDKQQPENPEHRIPEEFRNLSDYQVSSRKQLLLSKQHNAKTRISTAVEEATECKEAD